MIFIAPVRAVPCLIQMHTGRNFAQTRRNVGFRFWLQDLFVLIRRSIFSPADIKFNALQPGVNSPLHMPRRQRHRYKFSCHARTFPWRHEPSVRNPPSMTRRDCIALVGGVKSKRTVCICLHSLQFCPVLQFEYFGEYVCDRGQAGRCREHWRGSDLSVRVRVFV